MPRRSLSPTSPLLGADGAGAAAAVARTQSDHWKKLLRGPKEPVRIGVADFVVELNRRLRADPCFRDGTRFIVASADDTRPGGPTWEGPEAMKPLVVRIVQGAVGEFEVEHPFFSDR